MPDSPPIKIRVETDITAIPAADWDTCAGAANPFLSHAFLAALEESGSAAKETGWLPHHVLVDDAAGNLVAAVPAYLKSHSYGEYVFDHGWAQAFEQAGGRYYPKLQVSVPFTPATGPRLLGAADLRPSLVAGLEAVAKNRGLSSVHATFLLPEDRAAFEQAGWLLRTGVQFHWHNQGYACFDDFLAALASRKRKAIRKERQEVAAAGIEMVTLSGGDLKPEHWRAFFGFYTDTADRKWGSPYLTADFFQRLGQTLADKVVLVMARYQGHWVAGALNLLGADTLYGRNWGCAADFKFLHFETCYYQAIDFAIAHGLTTVEAGAQGEHKIQRGYLPVPMISAHWIAHSQFRTAVADFLRRETAGLQAHIAALSEGSPFRKTESD